jgi:hypothetical protein
LDEHGQDAKSADGHRISRGARVIQETARKKMTRVWEIAMLALLIGCDQQQSETSSKASSSVRSAREDYEMRERCGKVAADWFKNYFGSKETESYVTPADYSNHYNRKLNKCFVLANGTSYPKSKRNKNDKFSYEKFVQAILLDVNENKLYGGFFETDGKLDSCKVLEVPCTSLDDWKRLVRSYMED